MTTIVIITIVTLVLIYVASIFVPSMFLYHQGYTAESLAGKVIVAHRGGASLAPENSLLAIEKGILSGADMIEIDIHQTLDNAIVVCHDPTIDRTTTGSGKIAELTLAQIKQFSIIDSEGNATNERIATLRQVLDLVESHRAKGSKVTMLIEIKHASGQYPGIEQRLIDEIRHRNAFDWCTAQSFADPVLFTLHSLCPELRIEKLLICRLPGLPFIIDGFNITRFSYEKYHFVSSFNLMWQGTSRSDILDIHSHGKEVKLWTMEGVDAPVLDADGFITNRPDIWQNTRLSFGR